MKRQGGPARQTTNALGNFSSSFRGCFCTVPQPRAELGAGTSTRVWHSSFEGTSSHFWNKRVAFGGFGGGKVESPPGQLRGGQGVQAVRNSSCTIFGAVFGQPPAAGLAFPLQPPCSVPSPLGLRGDGGSAARGSAAVASVHGVGVAHVASHCLASRTQNSLPAPPIRFSVASVAPVQLPPASLPPPATGKRVVHTSAAQACAVRGPQEGLARPAASLSPQPSSRRGAT